MSKVNSEDLFTLIRSLSKNEKRYFKVFASRHVLAGKNKYVSLFDAIVTQEEYNENEILREEKRFGKKQLADLKNYLYRLILKSLAAFHSDNSISSQLKNIFRQIEILFEKGLYSQCEKLVQRARKICNEHELNHNLLEIFFWEKKIINATAGGMRTISDLGRLYNEEKDALQQLQQDNYYWYPYAQMFVYSISEGHLRRPSQLNKLKKSLEGIREVNAHTIASKVNYFFANEIYAFILQDWKSLYSWCKKHLKMMEENSMRLTDSHMNPYIGLLNNFFTACLHFKKYDEALVCIMKIRQLSSRSEYTHVRIFSRSYMLELYLYGTTGEPEKALPRIPEIETGLLKFKNKIPREHLLILYHNTFYIFFMAEQFSASLRWLNKILDNTDSFRGDVQGIARILNLVVHFEIGNMEMLPYIIKSSERFLSKRNRLYTLEKRMLKFFHKLSATDDLKKQMEYFIQLKKEIINSPDEPAIKTAYEYFDFMSWVECKLENCSFAEVVRKKTLV